MAGGDAVHPSRAKSAIEVTMKNDFGLYQICILVITQLAYWPVCGSMLSVSFLKMSQEACGYWRETNGSLPEGEYHSLLVDWKMDCSERSGEVVTVVSTMIMLGGLVGAFATGFLADRFGRKPIVLGTLVLLSGCNFIMLLASVVPWWWATLPVYFLMGCAGGGYMTTNLVLVVESLCSPNARLLVVAVNGWSASMALTAGLAYLLPYWFHYHLAVAVIALGCTVLLYVVADESLRWLRSKERYRRYDEATDRLKRFNRGKTGDDVALIAQLQRPFSSAVSGQLTSRPPSRQGSAGTEEGYEGASVSTARSYGYGDMFRMEQIRTHLLALGYCFFVSSIVSFGFYFAVDSLSGNRYANIAIMGAGKFLLGLLPFIVASCCSRKQVALISVSFATLAAWGIVACLIAGLSLTHIATAVLSIVVAASLDPTWKVSHLYSTELFPTTVRNMARGFCNAAARTGSVLAPLTAHFRHDLPVIPYSIFACLLTVQVVVIAIFLPNEVPDELLDTLPPTPLRKTFEAGDERTCARELTPLTPMRSAT